MDFVINVVDDERHLNDLVSSYLKKEGFIVNSLYSYDEALKCLDKPVHLWILDIMLHDKSGFDLIEQIKLIDNKVPVVFMSARDQEIDRVMGLEKGSDDYITKPFLPKELVLRVNNIIRRVYGAKEKLMKVNDYQIDMKKRQVKSENKIVELTAKEFDMLVLFIKNKSTALDRYVILEKVWEVDYHGTARVVDDTIRRLRKKLPNLNINTIYGQGYRLD